MPDNIEIASDAFNSIFALQLKWSEDRHDDDQVIISRAELAEMHRLCEVIASTLKDRQICNAIWILTQAKNLIPAGLIKPKLMESFDLADQEKIKIQRSVRSSRFKDPYFIDEDRICDNLRGHPKNIGFLHSEDCLFRELSQYEYGRIFNMFYPAEERILKRSGFNQNSIAIIINKLRERQEAIRINLASRSSVYINRYLPSIESLKTFANTVESIAGRMRNQETGYVNLAKIKSLHRSKEKVIGLATLWGDAVPLLVSQDWGIAGVISTTAGATVAAVMPSNPKGADAS